jgi:hypothetical protein
MAGSRTSLHGLNGDRRLGTVGKVLYFALNRVNNALPYAFVDPGLTIRDFVCPRLDEHRPHLTRGASPSRTLSDLFWLTLPWPAIHRELGNIRILDAGCGSGGYGPRLLSWADGHIESYTGTDVRPSENWTALEARDPRLRFYPADAGAFRGTIPAGTNVFMSQSALEHFDLDLKFFEDIRDYISSAPGPVLQIHMVPSQACLGLFLLHGVRQYTPRTLSRVTRLFASDSSAVVYRLGGRRCIRLHQEFITGPVLIRGDADRRETEPAEYERRLFEAIRHDMRGPQRSPAWYALIIRSRWTERAF